MVSNALPSDKKRKKTNYENLSPEEKRIQIANDRNLAAFTTSVVLTAIAGLAKLNIAFFFAAIGVGLLTAHWPSIKHKLSEPTMLYRLCTIGAIATIIFGSFAGQAHAQWLGDVESAVAGAFPDAEDIIEIVFWILRFFFIVLFVISLINVWQAVRNQSGIQEAIAPPIIGVVLLTIADVVTQRIIA